MPSRAETYTLPFLASPPLAVLPRRTLVAVFPLPEPLLRALGPAEKPDAGIWSAWLADWGWTWAVSHDACAVDDPQLAIWLGRGGLPFGFDARALALAVALRLKVDGQPLLGGGDMSGTDLDRVWRVLSGIPQDALGQVLALSILRADEAVFDFRSVCPQWPADVARVVAERRALLDERQPKLPWLSSAYILLGESFQMLRLQGATLEDCETVWDEFANGNEVPQAFEMAFWWEAAYCLTERHAYEAAEIAQQRVAKLAAHLEDLTGLVDSLWHHQQGRLHYYAGNHEAALAEFLSEYQAHAEDLSVIAMLEREIANVLSDLACLEAAQRFAERSVANSRAQGQKGELFKSLGRLAEIHLKLGSVDEAEKLHEESLGIQQKLTDNRAPSQTLTYLGHVALLKGELDRAADWYGKAEAKDGDRTSAPYLIMGRFALASRLNNAVEIDQLWNMRRHEIAVWATHSTHVLPASVCVLVASRRSSQARSMVAEIVRSLLDRRYPIEAIRLAEELPVEDRDALQRDAIAILVRWQKALSALPPGFREITGSLNGPTQIIDAVRKKNLSTEPSLNFLTYPMNLAATAGEGRGS